MDELAEKKMTDEQLLKDNGWKKQDNGNWMNTLRFTGHNDRGLTQSVPDGVTRSLEEAVKLENMRPAPKV